MTNEEFIQSIALPGEEWRDVVGWDRYMISSFGRIASKFAAYNHQGAVYIKRAALLNPTHNGGNPGYLTIMLSDGNGNVKRRSIHRLVASTFIPNPLGLPQVNHKDENSRNNRVDNLEWCTQSYNNAYGTCRARGAKKRRFSSKKRREVVQLTESKDFIKKYDSIAFASDETQIPRTTIDHALLHGNIVRGKYYWMYLSDYESQVSMSKNSEPDS